MPWTREDLTRLVELEAHQQGVDPRLAVALAEQESGFNSTIRSPKGAYGVFQLMPGTAKQLKVNIDDPADNIRGGVTYLKQQLDAFGGDPAKAIAAYNAGPGVVHAYKGVPPYKETRGLVSRVMQSLGPASAEAATPQAQPQSLGLAQTQAAGMSRLQELEAHLARLEGQQAKAATPPTATSTPEQDAAYRASRGQQEGATAPQTSPAPPTPPGARQGPLGPNPLLERFLALPSIRQLTPADLAGKQRDFAALTPALQEEFLRSEEPASDLVVDIEKPSAEQAQLMPHVQAQAPQAGQGGVLPVPPPDQPLEEGITKPSTMIPLLMPGAGVTALGRQMLSRGAGRVLRPIAEGLSQTLGFGTGRTIETGKAPSPGELGTELAVTTGTGGILEGIGAIGANLLRRSKGGQAIINADKLTRDADAKWKADTQAAEEAAKSQQKELYDTAVIKAKTSQREYEMAARQRQQTIAANQQNYDEAVRAERESAYNARQQKIADEQAGYQSDVQARAQTTFRRQHEYTGAVQQQGQVLTEARAIPARYKPATPSWVLYEKYGDAAKDTVMDLTPANAALAELRVQRGVLPDGTMRPFPKAVEDIAANLEQATGPVPFETIRQEIRKLGPLTRHGDGNIRGPAKQLMGVLADVLDTAPGANDLLKQANANFRREMAVKDMDDWLKPGHGIVSKDRFNREKINVAKLFGTLDKTIADDSLFRGSFTPDERTALQADFGKFAGTPNMPTRVPGEPPPVPVPQPEYLPGSAPNVPGRLLRPPREPGAVALPPDVPVKQVPTPPVAEEPTPQTAASVLGSRPPYRPLGGTAGEIGGLEYLASNLGIKGGIVAGTKAVIAGTQQARWLMAHAMLDPSRRPLMQAAIDGQGILNPRFYSLMLASLSPAERKAFERETGGVTDRRSASERAPGGAARQTD